MSTDFNVGVVEALIMASPEPLPGRKLVEVFDNITPGQVSKMVTGLNERYAEGGASHRIREIAGGYQFYIMPEYAGYVEELFTRRRKMRLTRAALETLAVAAYQQPVTKAEIEHIRGVASDGVIHNLLEKNMLTIKGRAATVGKPLQYGTTDEFLKFFGLKNLSDMPKMSEIEELVAAAEPNDQPELPLTHPEEGIKLNVADGTFDPAEIEEQAIEPTLEANNNKEDEVTPESEG